MTRKFSNIVKTFLALAPLFVTCSSHALLVPGVPVQNIRDIGVGSANAILTIPNSVDSTSASGSVSWNGTNDVKTGDTLNGPSQTQTHTLGELGILSAASLRVVFNANEPPGLFDAGANVAENGVGVRNVIMNIFSQTGQVLFSSGPNGTGFFSTTSIEQDTWGFAFRLDNVQVAEAQAAAFGSNFVNNRVGLSVALLQAQGNPEKFFVIDTSAHAVQEPGTAVIFAIGILGLVVASFNGGKNC